MPHTGAGKGVSQAIKPGSRDPLLLSPAVTAPLLFLPPLPQRRHRAPEVKGQGARCLRERRTCPSCLPPQSSATQTELTLIFEGTDTHWTFRRLDDFSNSVASHCRLRAWPRATWPPSSWRESRNEFVGLCGHGQAGRGALINTNLRGDALLHCLTSLQARALVFGSEMAQGPEWQGTGRSPRTAATLQPLGEAVCGPQVKGMSPGVRR